MCRETETVVKTWFSPCHIYIGHRFPSLGTSYGHLASRRARRRRRGRDVKLPTTSRATRRETEPDSKMHTQQLDASSRVLAASLGASLSFTSRPGERRGRCVRTEREVISLVRMRQETEAAGKMVCKQSCDHHLLVHCPLSSLGASVWITSRPVRSSVRTHRGRARSSSTCF